MLENPDLEQDFHSKIAESIYKTGHDSIRLMKCLAYYVRSIYENINFYDMTGTIVKEFIQV